ncbi:DJ-1/PfpI family protein [Chitinophaga nivalis]|uniref:DJ-1/PfpI family protein n=1 Tax=Chitinophaga nivalis TaxID=2991709 RepID=A0ABT3IJY9_9BACT|nr:DJ-1/PfpI family protein [Chitinophaga nivalis]MCW3466031.1 DJ-1/PfpI family protein [Chitinophaga nivalis]MCW3484278.1 DJ-1/PfpI family protein [Chitinophaga nivalis]
MPKVFHLLCLLLCAFVFPVTAQTLTAAYYCPPCNQRCDDNSFTAAGTCPHCGMTLITQAEAAQAKAKAVKPLTILFYLQDGVEVLDFAGPMEVFAYAGFKIATVSKTTDPILSQGILKIIPDYSIANAPQADIVAFFGGSSSAPADDTAVLHWLQKKQAPTYYFSVCTGAFVLGKAGFLDHQTATTFHARIDNLRKALPKTKVLSGVRYVDNGRVITTAGISAGIDGALHLVAKIYNKAVATQVAQYMEYDKWVPDQGLVVQPGH